MPRELNPCGKTRPANNPYERWEGNGWRWDVLKKYKGPTGEAADPFARWFCKVYSPMMPEGELGDVYVADVKRSAVKTA